MGGVTTGIKAQVTDLVNHGAIFVIFIALVLLILAVILLALYVVRVAITVIVVVAGPLALVCHASPYSEGIATLWWRALIGVLGIQVLQAITLIVFIKALFQQDSTRPSSLLGPANGLMNLIICCVLFGILIKIPSLVMRHVGLGGRSAIASVIKFALLAKGLGMLGLGTKGSMGSRVLGGAGRGSRRGPALPGPSSPSPGPSSPRPEPTGPPPTGGAPPTPAAEEQRTVERGEHRQQRRDAKRQAATERAREAAIRAWSAPRGTSERISTDAQRAATPPAPEGTTPKRGTRTPKPSATPAAPTAGRPDRLSTVPRPTARTPRRSGTTPQPAVPVPTLERTGRTTIRTNKAPDPAAHTPTRISTPARPVSTTPQRMSTPHPSGATPARISGEPARISQTPTSTGKLRPAPAESHVAGETHRVRRRSAHHATGNPASQPAQPKPRSRTTREGGQ